MADSWVRLAYRDVGLVLLAFFLLVGGAYSVLLPPFLVPDERAHWLAAHHHLARAATGSGTVCSTDVALDRHFQLGIQFQPKRKLPAGSFTGVRKLRAACEEELLYPTGNLLSYPGVLLTRLLVPREPSSGSQSLFAFYLARLLHGLFVAGLLGRIWWLARDDASGPPGLLALLLLASTPLFVQQSFGVSIDVVTNAFALCVCLWLAFPERLTHLDRAALLALGAITATGKPVLSIVLLPALALGLYLERLRLRPEAPPALGRALVEEIGRRQLFVLALLAIAVVGVVYAPSQSFTTGRAARQLAFVADEPWRAFQILCAGLWKLASHPSFFVDYLGYLDTRVGAATLRDFAIVAGGVALLELLALAAGLRRLRRDAARRRALSAAARPIAVLSALALAAVGVSILGVALHAYLSFTAPGRAQVASLQPRYFFPHLLVALGFAMALARTLAGAPAAAPAPARHPARVLVPALYGLALASFAAHLAGDLLLRFW